MASPAGLLGSMHRGANDGKYRGSDLQTALECSTRRAGTRSLTSGNWTTALANLAAGAEEIAMTASGTDWLSRRPMN